MSFVLLLALLLTLAFAPANGAAPQVSGSSGNFPDANAGWELITHRDIDGSTVLKKASAIFKERLATSNPLKEAAVDLIHSCKAAKETTDAKASHDLEEMAKKLYSIRATLVDLTSASVKHPSVCVDLANTGQQESWYHSLHFSGGGGKPSRQVIDGCVKTLWSSDNSWTSFKNNGQDANTLCEVPGNDHASRMILDMLNAVNDIIPDWLDIFNTQKADLAKEREQRKMSLREINELQQKLRQERLEDHESAKAEISEILEKLGSRFEDLSRQAEDGMVHIDTSVARMQDSLVLYGQELRTRLQENQQLAADYSRLASDALLAQRQGIQDMNQTIDLVVAAYQDTNAGILSQAEAFADSVQFGMRQAMDLQQQQLDGAYELASLQQQARLVQQEALAYAQETRKEVANLSGLLMPLIKLVGPFIETSAPVLVAVAWAVVAILVCAFGRNYWGPTLVLFTVFFYVLEPFSFVPGVDFNPYDFMMVTGAVLAMMAVAIVIRPAVADLVSRRRQQQVPRNRQYMLTGSDKRSSESSRFQRSSTAPPEMSMPGTFGRSIH